MQLDAVNGWFEAGGLPITPYDDAGNKNYYPMVKVTARGRHRQCARHDDDRAAGERRDHLRGLPRVAAATETNAARTAAKPAGNWVYDADPEKDWKKNILKLHDEKQAGNPDYQAALTDHGPRSGPLLLGDAVAAQADAVRGLPRLQCARHQSLPGTAALTSARALGHGKVNDPTNRHRARRQHQPQRLLPVPSGLGDQVPARRDGQCGRRVGQRADGLPELPRQHDQGRRPGARRLAAGADLPGLPLQRQAHDQRRRCRGQPGRAGRHALRHQRQRARAGLQPVPLQQGPRRPAVRGLPRRDARRVPELARQRQRAEHRAAGLRRHGARMHRLPRHGAVSRNGGPHGMHTIGAAWVSKHGDHGRNRAEAPRSARIAMAATTGAARCRR